MKRDLYAEVSARIIAELEKGRGPLGLSHGRQLPAQIPPAMP
jgi:hypothetical protein